MQEMTLTSLDRLRHKRRQLAERIKQLEAQANQKRRKQDIRRKILLGALLVHWMQDDAELKERVTSALSSFLTRQVDRDIFALDDPDTSVPIPTT
jgi:large subunit ribosomal protein L7/L12